MDQKEFYDFIEKIENLYEKYLISLDEYYELKNRLVTEYQGFSNIKKLKIKKRK